MGVDFDGDCLMSRRRGRKPSATLSEFRQSMVQVQIGNRVYDAVYHPTCHTCKHPGRQLIEEKILQNFSFAAIAELYSQKIIQGEAGQKITLPTITPEAIRRHFDNGHMPLEAATLRHLSDQRARQIGSAYEENLGQFVDHMVLAQATVSKVYEALVKDELELSVKDGLAAAKLLADVEADTQGGLDAEAWSDAMMIYFETARHHMDERAWRAFTADLAANPILRAMERKLSPGTVVDAQLITPEALERGAS
jgi:hypothetical protein